MIATKLERPHINTIELNGDNIWKSASVLKQLLSKEDIVISRTDAQKILNSLNDNGLEDIFNKYDNYIKEVKEYREYLDQAYTELSFEETRLSKWDDNLRGIADKLRRERDEIEENKKLLGARGIEALNFAEGCKRILESMNENDAKCLSYMIWAYLIGDKDILSNDDETSMQIPFHEVNSFKQNEKLFNGIKPR